MTKRRKQIGRWGEDQACLFLQRKGFNIVEKNFFTNFGEIDIIACKGDDFYFIEVKTRSKGSLASTEAISARKIRNMERLAGIYCYRRGVKGVSIMLAGIIIAIDRAKKSIEVFFCLLD